MSRFLVLLMLGAVAWGLLSCSSGSGPESGSPLFTVRVVDAAGNPVAGLRVGSINHSEYLGRPTAPPMACPSTGISFQIPEATHVRLVIYNYYHELIRTLVDETLEAGQHDVTWDGRDDDGHPVISGYYYYHLTAGDSSDEKAMVIEYGPDPERTVIGVTNSEGVFSTSDTLLFPCLLGDPPPITIVSETGDPITVVTGFYQDVVTITLSDEYEPEMFLYFEKVLQRSSNYVRLTWNPNPEP